MSHIAVLLDNYSIECSCGYYSPNIQTLGNHRATQAWDEAASHLAGEYDDHAAAQHLHETNPHRTKITTRRATSERPEM